MRSNSCSLNILLGESLVLYYIQTRIIRMALKLSTTRSWREEGSKYDPILDAFMSGTEDLVTVEAPEKDANNLRTQRNKRTEAKRLRGVKVLVINDTCYLAASPPLSLCKSLFFK